MRNFFRNKKVVALIILFLVIVAAWHWGKKYYQAKSGKPDVLVQVQPVKVAVVAEKINAVGTLRAPQDVNVSPEIDGYVTKIAFTDGQIVKKGDLLFQLDDTKEQANLLSAQADYAQAKNKVDRMQSLIKSHFVSSQDIDTARAELQAKAAAVKTAQDSVNKKAIIAPFSGALGARTVCVGNYVTAGQKLVQLVDRSNLKVDYSIPEKYFQEVKIGQPITVTTSGESEKKYIGSVVYIAPTVDPNTHTLALQGGVANTENLLAPGLFVQIDQIMHTNDQAILVPEQSLVKSLDKIIVYRVINSKAVATPVEIGVSEGGYVEVHSGLNSNDSVVVAGQQQLNDGDPVEIVK